MALNFDKYAQAGNEFINELGIALDQPDDKESTGRKLKAVLHTLRDQLNIEESVQLISQLPMFLKAVYVENWTPHKPKSKIHKIDEFYECVRTFNGRTLDFDFPTINDANRTVAVVIYLLKKYVSEGEMEDIKAVLPKELKPLIEVAVVI